MAASTAAPDPVARDGGARPGSADRVDLSNRSTAVGLERIGVVGGGTMGSGIVHAALAAGIPVTLVEADAAALARADALVRRSLAGAEARGKLGAAVGGPGAPSTAEAALEGLTLTTDRSALAEAPFVIEAVPEILDLKSGVLRDIETHLADDAVLATNTSSLSLATLGAGLRRPQRFVGTHFFNPVPVQVLLELVRTSATDAPTLERARALARRLRKEVVEVTDSPGFATSRLGVALGLEATRMVQEGVATPEDIDKAMVLGYRYPMGPCRLGDLVGHDVRLGIAEYLASTLGPRFEPPHLLRDMVARGDLGQKSGRGFYDWTKD
ncbi:MAG: 3-hydroxyacyl-CoA dehydrogenase family protein [Actinomycetales bacterium]|nr:3-hydroxyacyl-CoA dehydrogenase family protein [Actinomycetales bacterium]